MRILFVSPFLPYPPAAGGHAQVWGWMRRLAPRHALAFVGFFEREPEAANVPEVEKLCAVTRARLRKPTLQAYWSVAQVPHAVSEFFSRELAEDVRQACASFRPQVVQFLSPHMAQYQRYVGNAPTVVTALELGFVAVARRIAACAGLEHLRARCEWVRTLRYEAVVMRRANHVITMSEHDAGLVSIVAPRTPVTAIPPGLDREAFAPRERQPRPGSVLYLGLMEHYPNLDGLLFLYRDVWPHVQREIPGAHLTVVGKGAREELARVSPETLAAMEGDPSVELAGFVPDLREALDTHAVMAAPLRLGGGVRNKVIESMAAGLPVVTTSRGAEGLAVHSERELLIADRPEEIARQLVRVLTDSELSLRLAEAGRALAAREHDSDALTARLEQALLQTAGVSE
jgi:glycosyltransferase involved in cell wall biosynthesis